MMVAKGICDNFMESFIGFENEQEMRLYCHFADQLITLATVKKLIVCSKHSQCLGSINGIDFLYSDGSKDSGREINIYTAKLNGTTYKWFDD